MRNSDVYPSFCGCLKMLLFMYIISFFQRLNIIYTKSNNFILLYLLVFVKKIILFITIIHKRLCRESPLVMKGRCVRLCRQATQEGRRPRGLAGGCLKTHRPKRHDKRNRGINALNGS